MAYSGQLREMSLQQHFLAITPGPYFATTIPLAFEYPFESKFSHSAIIPDFQSYATRDITWCVGSPAYIDYPGHLIRWIVLFWKSHTQQGCAVRFQYASTIIGHFSFRQVHSALMIRSFLHGSRAVIHPHKRLSWVRLTFQQPLCAS